ncbi:MAG: hypothetical protein EXR99_03665 [Gemmataceae bacterium]|nr:hypothetical protein [Gemmataceae bacterium]
MVCQYPILLAHGIAPFDFLSRKIRKAFPSLAGSGDSRHYFKGVKSFLNSRGFEAHHGDVSFAASVDLRARELASQVEAILKQPASPGRSHEKVLILAHSMGGLDARRMIVDFPGLAEKVAGLATIGTPHLGSSFADLGMQKGGNLAILGLKKFVDLAGFADLTTQACKVFNQRSLASEAANGVVYHVWSSHEEKSRVYLPLRNSWSVIHEKEGANDGLVSVTSQEWASELALGNGARKTVKQFRFPFLADHLNQIAWWSPKSPTLAGKLKEFVLAREFEKTVLEVYLEIAQNLAKDACPC